MTDSFKGVDLASPPPTPEEPETKEEETKEEEQQEPKEKTLGEVLQTLDGAPGDDQIEQWKQQYGEVLCSMFSETEIFIFRPINREEWVNLQMHISNAQAKGEQISTFDVEEKIVQACTLWYSKKGMEGLLNKAGGMTTLHEQILQNSNFVNAALAGQFVVKL